MKIMNVTEENLDDFIKLCIPPGREKDELFFRGGEEKRRWALQMMKRHGSVAKIAYLNSRPAGLIQYVPQPDEKVVQITCIFVPERENLRKGIGRALLNVVIEVVKRLEPRPSALVTWAFRVPETFPQDEFFRRMGFREVEGGDTMLLYYPLQEGFVYRPERKEYIP